MLTIPLKGRFFENIFQFWRMIAYRSNIVDENIVTHVYSNTVFFNYLKSSLLTTVYLIFLFVFILKEK